MTRERIGRFVKNLASALCHCLFEGVFEDGEVFGAVILALACIGIFWLVGVVVYELIFDPHLTTVAALDSLSIDPDKWFPRS